MSEPVVVAEPVTEPDPTSPEHGIRQVERLVQIQAADPEGGALFEAIRRLSLNEAHALLYVAVAGIAASRG